MRSAELSPSKPPVGKQGSALRFGPALALAVLIGPVLCGIVATLLPAFGFMPTLGGASLSLDPFRELAAQPGIARSALLSLSAGLVTTVLALLTVMIFIGGWYGTPIFNRLQHMISPLLSVPHAAAAFGLAFLIAPSGFLMRLVSPWATGSVRPPDVLILQDPAGLSMILGLTLKEIPFLLLVSLAALPQTDPTRRIQMAQSLGYGRLAATLLTVWPLVYRQIRLAIFAVIAYASSVVDVSLILGPSTPSTLAVRLTQWMADPDISLRFMASAGAILQLCVTLTAIGVWIVGEKLVGRLAKGLQTSGRRFQRDGLARALGLATALLATGLVFAGLAVLALWSFSGFWAFPDALPQSFTLRNWARASQTMAGPLTTTLTTAVAATAIAIILALACLEREFRTRRRTNNALLLIYLPLIIPQVGFVFGLQLFFLSFGADASWAALVFAHLVFVFPYVFLSLSDPWRSWDQRYATIASGLGASPNRIFWRIRLPMVLKPVLVAMAVGFAVSIGQYLPTILIGAGRLPTITTEAVALASGGNRQITGVYAFLQMLLPAIGFTIALGLPAVLFRNRKDMTTVNA